MFPAGGRAGALWLAGVMICRSTSIGVRGCHRRDAGPRAVAAGEARGRAVAAAAGRGRGESSRRAVARPWALGLALPGGRPYRPWPGSPRPGLLLGATWGGFRVDLAHGRAVAPLRRSGRFVTGSRWAVCRTRPSRGAAGSFSGIVRSWQASTHAQSRTPLAGVRAPLAGGRRICAAIRGDDSAGCAPLDGDLHLREWFLALRGSAGDAGT